MNYNIIYYITMNEKQYNNNIKKIVKLMSIESKVNIVGSAKIKRNIYAADYDSFETVKSKNENIIYNHFKSQFEIIKSVDNTIITDFKLGEFRGKALRWDNEAIKKDNTLIVKYLKELNDMEEIEKNYLESFEKVVEKMDKINIFVNEL